MKIEQTGYGRVRHVHNAEMTEVGPGTPMGELLRRYWQPVGLSGLLGEDPLPVRILGEDLILFRDKRGRVGLLDARCCHRGATLYYGKIEERGIRCCYHGWLYDVDGRCLEMPCEPEGSKRHEMVRQPWYPTREYRGLAFAYMGPPDRLPAFPIFDAVEYDAAQETKAVVPSEGHGSGGNVVAPTVEMNTGSPKLPANWLQIYENVMDPYHVFTLHMNMTGEQFAEAMGLMPEITWKEHALGITSIQDRRMKDGKLFRRVTQSFDANVRFVPTPQVGEEGYDFARGGTLSWVVPIDDTTTTFFSLTTVERRQDGGPYPLPRSRFGGKPWESLTEIEHRRMPGDVEAQVGQGPITMHKDEHLVLSDRGVMMLRRLLKRQLGLIREGKDPIGIVLDREEIVIETEAGNYLLDLD